MHININIRTIAAGTVALALLLPNLAGAQGYPNRPVKIINPFSAGGPSDVTAREIAAGLQAALGQPFVVESRAGASGTIGAAYVAEAAPDGYTLLLAAGPQLAVPAPKNGVPFDGIKEYAPIALIQTVPNIMIVGPSVKAENLRQMVDLAKSKPGGVSYGSPGFGGPQRVAAAMLQKEANVPMIHVPYNGAAPMMTDIMSGQVDFGFVNLSAVLQHMKTGRLRGFAVASKARSPAAPDVPTLTELGYPIVADSWQGLLAPAGTPPEVVHMLSAQVAKILATPAVRARMESGGRELVYRDPEGFLAFLKDDKLQLDKARAAGITANP